jgi:hypothetical protein
MRKNSKSTRLRKYKEVYNLCFQKPVKKVRFENISSLSSSDFEIPKTPSARKYKSILRETIKIEEPVEKHTEKTRKEVKKPKKTEDIPLKRLLGRPTELRSERENEKPLKIKKETEEKPKRQLNSYQEFVKKEISKKKYMKYSPKTKISVIASEWKNKKK